MRSSGQGSERRAVRPEAPGPGRSLVGEIHAARRRLAACLHPDQHAQAPPEVQVALAQAMAEVNATCDRLLAAARAVAAAPAATAGPAAPRSTPRRPPRPAPAAAPTPAPPHRHTAWDPYLTPDQPKGAGVNRAA